MTVPGRPNRHASRGISLVLVLVLMAALALSAAATLRMSTASYKVSTSFRMQSLALLAAEAALRFCEAPLVLADAQRSAEFQEAALPLTLSTSPAWVKPSAWVRGELPGPPADWLQGPGSPAPSAPRPVCLVERQALGSGQVYVVTARGFSPDWRADATSGATLSGSAVWLQSVLLIHAGLVRDRVQRRLVQPPLR